MATSYGQGTGAAQQPVDFVINTLMNEQVQSSEAFAAASACAPVMGSDALSGSYPVEDGWFGLRLDKGTDPGTSVNYASSTYPQATYQWDSKTYTIERYNIDEWSVPDIIVQDILARTGKDLNSYLAEKGSRIAKEVYAKKVFELVGDSSEWDTDHTSDPGNITSSSFNFIQAIVHKAVDQMMKANKYDGSSTYTVAIAWDVVQYLLTLQQVRTAVSAVAGVVSGETAGQILTSVARHDQIAAAIETLFPGNAKCVIVPGYYLNASSTATLFFSGKIAVLPTAGGVAPTFARTITLNGETSPYGSIESEYDSKLRGNTYSLMGVYNVHKSDDQAGYLFTSLLS